MADQDVVPRFEWCIALVSCTRDLAHGPNEAVCDGNLIVWVCRVIELLKYCMNAHLHLVYVIIA